MKNGHVAMTEINDRSFDFGEIDGSLYLSFVFCAFHRQLDAVSGKPDALSTLRRRHVPQRVSHALFLCQSREGLVKGFESGGAEEAVKNDDDDAATAIGGRRMDVVEVEEPRGRRLDAALLRVGNEFQHSRHVASFASTDERE